MTTSTSMPMIVALSLSDLGLDEMNARIFEHLKQRGKVEVIKSRERASRRISTQPRPQAVLLTDGYITEPGQDKLREEVAEYARQGGTVVLCCQFSSFVSGDAMEALLQQTFGLPWTHANYYRSTFSLNMNSRNIDVTSLPLAYSMKAVTLDNVPSTAAVLIDTGESTNEPLASVAIPAGTVGGVSVAFAEVGKGYLGYVGDVNNEEPTSHVVSSMVFASQNRPAIASSRSKNDAKITPSQPTPPSSQQSSSPQNAKPKVVMISLALQGAAQFESMGQQIFSALIKHAELVQATTPQSAITHLSSDPKPTAVLLTHPGIIEHEEVIDCLRAYVNAGGRAIVGFTELLTHLPLPDFEKLFRTLDLRWVVRGTGTGTSSSPRSHRATFALDPTGIPAPLRPNALFAAYSMDAVHLARVKAKHRIYVPGSSLGPRAAGTAGHNTAEECPAAWASLGKGFVGFVGDVNAEEESTRLVLEMCGIRISPGDLGPRRVSADEVEVGGAATQCAERQLVVRAKEDHPQRRAREEEVAARAVKRADMSRRKRIVAEGLKEEGNKFFKEGKYAEAASRYRQAVLVYGPRPVYLTNLSAALLKMRLFSTAADVAARALFYEPYNLKALYRSGQACKEQELYDRAIEDFKAILRKDPSNAAAREALSEAIELNDGRGLETPEKPTYESGNALWDAETTSDSSEYEHEGNGTPCRYLNHDGCRHGAQCRWKHAADANSVRDQLGRNVCIAWLLGKCSFATRCFYAHDRTYLNHGGWWSDRAKVRELASDFGKSVNGPGRRSKRFESEVFFANLGVINEWRNDDWVSQQFSALDDEPVPAGRMGDSVIVNTTTGRNSRFRSKNSTNTRTAHGRMRAAAGHYDSDEYDWDDDEYEERANHFGFDEDDLNELLSQGVKPWDDDAWDVLDALRGM